MRKVHITVICLLLLVFLSGCAMVKKDLTPDEVARIAINSVVDEETDLIVQCRQYAAASPAFKLLFKEKLIPIFEQVNAYVDTALSLLTSGQPSHINLESARVLLRQIALELIKAKGGK